MQVDVPAKVRASFTQPVGQTFTTSMLWDQITVKNGNLLGVGGTKIFTSTTGRNATVDGAGLYPYLDGVGVYAGSCAANDPEAYKANYFVPGAPRGWTALNPGDNPRTVSVEMPTLRVHVTREPVGTPTATVPSWFRTQLRVTSLDTGCVSPLYEVQPTDRATNLNSAVHVRPGAAVRQVPHLRRNPRPHLGHDRHGHSGRHHDRPPLHDDHDGGHEPG